MNTTLRAVLAAVVVLAWSTPTIAVESSFPDIQRILDNGKLLVAILARDAPPMIMTDENGRLVGSEVLLALDIGKKMGVDVEFVRTAETYDGVVDVVARQEADIAVSFLSSGVRRATKVLFSRPYVRQSRRVFYNRARFAELRSTHSISTIEQVATSPAAPMLEVGVLEGSVYQAVLERDMPKFPVRPYGSLPEIVTAVREGRIFAGVHGELQIEFYMRQNPDTAIYVGVEPKVRHPSDISIAVRPDAPNLLRWVDVYLANYVGVLEVADVIKGHKRTRAESE